MPMTPEDIFEVKAGLAVAKNKTMNFAICMGKTPAEMVFVMHKTRSPDVLGRDVKSQGETKKIAFGTLDVAGSLVQLRCAEDVPTGIAKQARLFLNANKMSYKVIALDPAGKAADAEEDVTAAAPTGGAGPAAQAPATPEVKTETASTTAEPIAEAKTEAAQTTTEPILEPTDAQRDWARLAEEVNPLVLAYVNSGAEKADKVATIWKAAQAAAAGGKIPDARAAVDRIMPVLKQEKKPEQPATPTEQATTETKSEGDPELVDRIEAALKAMGARVQDAIKRLPSLKGEVLGMMAQARTLAKSGDASGADALVKRITTLLDRIDAQKEQAGQGAGGVSVKKLGQARIEWQGVRSVSLEGVATLKARIRKFFAGRPDLASRVENGLKTLDQAVGKLNEDLARMLDLVLNEADPAKRTALARDVAATARTFLNLTATDPVISVIDSSKFADGLMVVRPMADKLNEILDAVAQSATETAS
jgi:hypothetical protein